MEFFLDPSATFIVPLEATGKPERCVSLEDLKTNLLERFSNADVSEGADLESKEHLKVYLRIRPFTSSELSQNESQDCINVENLTNVILKAPRSSLICRLSEKGVGQVAQRFSFSQVFGPVTTQEELFDSTVKQLVQEFLYGQNSLLFTYGVTNAGKTYTFQGTDCNAGLLPRSMAVLFHNIREKLYDKMDFKPQRCREYCRLSEDQIKVEMSIKNSVLRLLKENSSQGNVNAPQCTTHPSESATDVCIEGSSSMLTELEESLKQSEQYAFDVPNVKFTVWVSFCEIYNECIYDLLDPIPSDKSQKRKMLRLAQDIKGNSYVKDLKWIQVSDPREACRILQLGKKHQSIACTKLNNLSSRSHSIFSVRILQLEDEEVPRVLKVSEFCMCDLAGSERCAKTQNEGDRLREAGNINTSLLTLGKCINALKSNQQSKLQQHVPFRESKLTHYLQSYFCGRGKTSMIVNISPCASMYDETLNVLKFSSVAQKVLVYNSSRPTALPCDDRRSASDVSLIINNADNKFTRRKRATILWDTSLEDVKEVDDANLDYEEDEEEEASELHEKDGEEASELHENDDLQDKSAEEKEKNVVLDRSEYEDLMCVLNNLKEQIVKEKKEKLMLEFQVRKEVTEELSQLFSEREKDFSERLQKERQLMEDRFDERLEIYKELLKKYKEREEKGEEQDGVPSPGDPIQTQVVTNTEKLDHILDSLQEDVADIKKQAETAQKTIQSMPDRSVEELEYKLEEVTAELEQAQDALTKQTAELEVFKTNTNKELQEANLKIESLNERLQECMNILQQKDEAISKLEELVSYWEQSSKEYEETIMKIKGKMTNITLTTDKDTLQGKEPSDALAGNRKRCGECTQDLAEQPPLKKGLSDEDLNRHVVKIAALGNHEKIQSAKVVVEASLHGKVESPEDKLEKILKDLQSERSAKDLLSEQVEHLKDHLSLSEKKVLQLVNDVEHYKSLYEILESNIQTQKDTSAEKELQIKLLTEEPEESKTNLSLKIAEIQALQVKQSRFTMLTREAQNTDAELIITKPALEKAEEYSTEKAVLIESLQTHLTSLSQELESAKFAGVKQDTDHFHDTIETMRKECEQIVKVSSKKSQQIQELEHEIERLQKLIRDRDATLVNQSEIPTDNCLLQDSKNVLQPPIIFKETCLPESETQALLSKEKLPELEKEIEVKEENKQFERELPIPNDNDAAVLESRLQEKDRMLSVLNSNLRELQEKLKNYEQSIINHDLQEVNLKEGNQQMTEQLISTSNSLEMKEKELITAKDELQKLTIMQSEHTSEIQTLRLNLRVKDEEYSDLKEKFADAKKQIQQVQREVTQMRDEDKLLRNKVNDYERAKNQLVEELAIKDRTIQQLTKDKSNNGKLEETLQLFQTTCKELQAKEKIISDMQLALTEQEQTQEEQDVVIDTKLEEIALLTTKLDDWKNKCSNLEKKLMEDQSTCQKCEAKESEETSTLACQEVTKTKEVIKETEEKHTADRKKWLEEKMVLINQAKDAEESRNREMRKYVEDRERCARLQADLECLNAQLSEKDDYLQQWRNERDQLVATLEVELKNLISSCSEKDEELQRLQKCVQEHPVEQDLQCTVKRLQEEMTQKDAVIERLEQQLSQQRSHSSCNTSKMNSEPETGAEQQKEPGHSEPMLDSSESSAEGEKIRRFPRPQLEIKFTPLQPNKMAVKHHGSPSAVTVKLNRTGKKRKSCEMEGASVEKENKENKTRSRIVCNTPKIQSTSSICKSAQQQKSVLGIQRNMSARKRLSQSSLKSSCKKDATLQKIGDFLQCSPAFLHSKAKKLIGTLKSASDNDTNKVKENQTRRTKRRLYNTDISSPLDIPSHQIIMCENKKESDHLIIKRRLRSRMAK
ncbi:kinesin-like protein KIF20B isoform X2 [Protopterus annectens]|uniref:kinesin-like protein KIF20B isoform X2 n=1 Tax=Protopterus annectens TaxID=7888 RepID=UPI001CFB43A7|nr:kinesin-like protein KIF20B isoform X2 [Protopterus annectens]